MNTVKRDRSKGSSRGGVGRLGVALGVVAVLLLAVAVVELRPGQSADAKVTRVYDGDTIEALVAGRSEKIRYIGIDTPEMDDPRPVVLEMAREAARANRELVGGRRVRLELDIQERDRYGRLLAYVWLGDTLVNEWLVKEGYAAAPTFPPNVRYQDRLRAAERDARQAGRRLWDGRLADGPLRIRESDETRRGATATPGDGQQLTAFEAAAHEGQIATVCGHVASTRWLGPGRKTFLNFERPYPNQPFTVVISAGAREAFERSPEDEYEDQDVCVAGVIELFKGKPQIMLSGPAQIGLR
jgi:endonuclease YncB( thermonuclease family)